ncbi:MAG: cytochrome c peroxidase [Pseudomonadota bacterium]
MTLGTAFATETPVFPKADPQKVDLGRLLFYDKILSGNKNIACATCHHPALGTSDKLSLGVGEGGRGLGPHRTTGTGRDRINRRVPRNAPGLWNLGASQINVLMHDGRISADPLYGNGFNTPAEEWLPQGLDTVLAAQALFPVTSETEMAGHHEENEVAGAVNDRIDRAWPILAKRVRSIPAYGEGFVAAFPHIDSPEQVSIVEIANAIGAFIAEEFQSLDSAYDAYLAGDATALSPAQHRGRDLFFGKAACAGCHAGPLFSDHQFRALGLPAFGPGRTRRFDPMARDVGRMGESDAAADAYRFRTPMLRNVALTAPYGHNGAYPTLGAMIRHHLDPEAARATWSPEMVTLPSADWLQPVDFVIQSDRLEMARQARARDIYLKPKLTEGEIADLVAFLESLTGAEAAAVAYEIPSEVPSGLPVDTLSQ